MTETELLVLVVGACRGLRVFRSSDSRRDLGRGWPDLVIANPRTCELAFVELKSADGDLEGNQIIWKYILLGAGLPWYLWRPCDWADGTIEKILDEMRKS